MNSCILRVPAPSLSCQLHTAPHHFHKGPLDLGIFLSAWTAAPASATPIGLSATNLRPQRHHSPLLVEEKFFSGPDAVAQQGGWEEVSPRVHKLICWNQSHSGRPGTQTPVLSPLQNMLSLDSAPQQVRSAPWQLSLAGGNDQTVALYCIIDPGVCYPSLWEDYTHRHPTAIRPGHIICFDQ